MASSSTPNMFAPFASNIKKNTPTLDFSSTKLVDAIQNNWVYEQLVQVIQAQPDGINEKGWHGFTPLHRAALRGDPAIISLLLEHGADVSEVNDYGETPLMYACKRGNPKNVHLFLEAGSKLDVEDHQGRRPVHHAAAGGSVHTLHYLEQVHHITFDERDKHGQTPLHVTCYQGFQDAVKYLLRKGRSDIMLPDNYGNLPIHIACLNSLSETCWTLLEMSSCQTLLIKNKEGNTPLDVLKAGRSMPHQHLFRELEYWSQSRAPHLPPKGPLMSWYTLLLGPFIFFALIVAIGSHIKQYGGIIMAIFTGILVFMVTNQQHRISHISRWANPVQCGAFFAGITHTAACYFYKVLPVLWPETVNLSLLLLVPLAFIMLTLYYRLITGDPGTCKTSQQRAEDGSVFTIEDIIKGHCKMEVFCVTCEIIRPTATKHCRLCHRCVRNLDHHCLFLVNCIGERNHRSFIIFLFLTSLAHLIFILHSCLFLTTLYPDVDLWPFLVQTFYDQTWVLILFFLNAYSVVWEICLIHYQLKYISRGLTTAYDISRRNPNYGKIMDVSFKDRLQNVKNFLLGRRTWSAFEIRQSRVV